jgi:hypothetical protein
LRTTKARLASDEKGIDLVSQFQEFVGLKVKFLHGGEIDNFRKTRVEPWMLLQARSIILDVCRRHLVSESDGDEFLLGIHRKLGALEELAAWRLGDCFGEILEFAKISFLRGAFA